MALASPLGPGASGGSAGTARLQMPGADAAPSPFPHPQLSTSLPHDPPLYPAALPSSRTCCFFPRRCQHISSGTCSGCGSGLSLGPISHPQLTLQPSEHSCLFTTWTPVRPVRCPPAAWGRMVLPSHVRRDPRRPRSPGGSFTAVLAGPDPTGALEEGTPGDCPHVSPCGGLSTHHVTTSPRAPGHSGAPGGAEPGAQAGG